MSVPWNEYPNQAFEYYLGEYRYNVFLSAHWDSKRQKQVMSFTASVCHVEKCATTTLGFFDTVEEAKGIVEFVLRSGQPIDFSVPERFGN